MDTQSVSEVYPNCDSNTNQNDVIDDDPCPPPGLRRLVTGQTVSFDDGLNSPPFDRVVPGEGREYSAPYQAFPTPIQSPSYDYWYSNNESSHMHDSRQTRDKHENESLVDKRQSQKSYNRENYENDSKLNKQYSFDSSHSKNNKIEPPLEQRMVVGETNNDAPVAQTVNRIRDDRSYDDDKSRSLPRASRRPGPDSIGSRTDKNRKKLPYDGRSDRCKIESDEDYDEFADRNYDNSPEHEHRSYHDKHRNNSPQRFGKRLPRRYPENSFTQSQDELYFDDDEDDYDNYRNHRRYYERRSHREQNYASHIHDSYHRDDRRYRKPDYDRRYEDDSFYGERNSRPSSRSGSEYRSLDYSNQGYHYRTQYYEHLDHRRIPPYGGVSKLPSKEIEKWSKIREIDPQAYMNWFRTKFPREYADWYTRFIIGKMVPNSSYQSDRRGSGHSGQSSVNNDTLSINEEKLLRVNELLMFKPVDSHTPNEIQERRSSPLKFKIPHVKGVFDALGQLMVINTCSAKDGQSTKIDIYQLLPPDNDPNWIEFMNFTGPFIVGETHVSTISDFVKNHASIAKTPSKKLLYLLIDLITKLRGVIDGIAISELLMASYHKNQNHSSSFAKDEAVKQDSGFSNLSEAEIIEKYTELLLQGNKNSALDWAVNHRLWGHAFLLASKIGPKYYSNVLAKFDASILTNNPLKTLYQLYSKQVPLAMTACGDEKWGDWRPHLAMILSNPTPDREINKTAIITLGDSLASRDIYASHFCYLVAQAEFEPPNKPSAKLSLLSLRNNVDHFGINTSNHAILLTQMYEFAKRLQKKDYTIYSLLPYKYLLATRLVDYGKNSIALQYLESIAFDLIKDPGDQNLNLMYNVLELSERIKYSDSKPLVADLSTEKQWLTDLRNIVETRFNTCMHVLANDQFPYKEIPPSDQSYQIHNFSQQPLIQPLQSNLSQQRTKFSPSGNMQQTVMFPTTSSNYQMPSLPLSKQNQSWENISYPQNNMDVASSGYSTSNQFQQIKMNDSSVDMNDNVVQPMNCYNQQPPSDENYYSPWDKPQQPLSISMHSRNNYFEDNSNKSATNENELQNRKSPNQHSEQVTKEVEKNIKENKHDNSNNNPGWLGGLFHKLSIRPTNQAILPDDKDPKLVWDNEKNCWVDKAKKDDDNSNTIKPPPKAAELQTFQSTPSEQSLGRYNEMPGGQILNSQFMDQNRLAPSNPPNMYKLSRGKGMKSNYVNILSNNTVNTPASGMPSPPNTVMDTSNVQVPPNVNLFIPNQH